MKLNELNNEQSPRKSRKRVGRGIGSGTGKTSGHGQKGQKARSGVSINGFEGGQMPIYRRVPKRGFVSLFRTAYQVVNVSDLQKFIDSGKLDAKKEITKEVLVQAGIVKKPSSLIKVLGKGELKAALKIQVDAASEAAVEIVKKAGGSITVAEKKSKVPSEKANKKKGKK